LWAIAEAARKGLQLDVTLDALKRSTEARLCECGDLYLDDAVSGSDMQRPGFLAFYDRAVHDPLITYCLFWARDRFARPEHAEEAVKLEKAILLAGKHTVVASGAGFGPRKRYDDKVHEDILLMIAYSTAGRFRPEIAQKVLRAAARNAKKGFSCGGRPPYGFVRALYDEASGETEPLSNGVSMKASGKHVVFIPAEDETGREQLRIVRRIHAEYHNRNRWP